MSHCNTISFLLNENIFIFSKPFQHDNYMYLAVLSPDEGICRRQIISCLANILFCYWEKTLWEMKKMMVTCLSSFPIIFSKTFLSRSNSDLFGKIFD